MKNSLIILILLPSLLFGKVQWAKKVISFSSQKSETIGSINQILGVPSVMPGFGASPCSWSPESESNINEEFVEVEFEYPLKAEKIAIFENYNPGAISKVIVSAKDTPDELIIFQADKFPFLDKNDRVFEIKIPRLTFLVSRAKVFLKTSRIPGFNQIDAIGITDNADELIQAKINNYEGKVSSSKPENLGIKINSEYTELSPIISFDGTKLYFSREGHPDNFGDLKKQDVWYSEIKNGDFKVAEILPRPINNEYNNYAISLSPSNNELLLGNTYKADGTLDKGISISSLNGKVWSLPKDVVIEGFKSKNNQSSFNLHASGKIMLMAIEDEDSYGANDLYVSFLNDNGTWSKPQNLGKVVNTAAMETSPFLTADGKTLFYATSGYAGYGATDMFVTKRLDDSWQNWSEPQNLGASINTDGWDAYYTIPANSEYAYYVSSKNTVGSEDIFRIKLPEELKPSVVNIVYGKVVNSKNQKPVSAKILYQRLSDGKELGIARSDSISGEFKIVLPVGEKYSFLAESKGYIAENQNIDLSTSTKYEELARDIALVPVEKGSSIRLNNIFFEFKEYKLLSESFPELNRVVKFLNQNPDIKIEIQGFTDNIGTQERNLKLSQNRADAVADYLNKQGNFSNRIRSKGYGKENPVAANDTEEGRTKNRRVEFRIVD